MSSKPNNNQGGLSYDPKFSQKISQMTFNSIGQKIGPSPGQLPQGDKAALSKGIPGGGIRKVKRSKITKGWTTP